MNEPQPPRSPGRPARDGRAAASGDTPAAEPPRRTRRTAETPAGIGGRLGGSPTRDRLRPAASPAAPGPTCASRRDELIAKAADWLVFAAGAAFGAALHQRLIASGHTELSYAALGLLAALAGTSATRRWLGTLPVRAPIIAYAPPFLTCLAAVTAGVAALLPDDLAALLWGAVVGLLVGVAGHLPLLLKHREANVAAERARTTAAGPPASTSLPRVSAAPAPERPAPPDRAAHRPREPGPPLGHPTTRPPRPTTPGSTP